MAEQRTHKPLVTGSNPVIATDPMAPFAGRFDSYVLVVVALLPAG